VTVETREEDRLVGRMSVRIASWLAWSACALSLLILTLPLLLTLLGSPRDALCKSTNVIYRLDTQSAREFLSQYVVLP
jgi:hypothetical protein